MTYKGIPADELTVKGSNDWKFVSNDELTLTLWQIVHTAHSWNMSISEFMNCSSDHKAMMMVYTETQNKMRSAEMNEEKKKFK